MDSDLQAMPFFDDYWLTVSCDYLDPGRCNGRIASYSGGNSYDWLDLYVEKWSRQGCAPRQAGLLPF